MSDKPETLFGLPIVESDAVTEEELAIVGIVCGSFGARKIRIDGDYQKVMREAAASDPKLARELKRRGWLP